MASCDYCGTFILFGGVTDGPRRFCNEECHQGGFLLAVAGEIPAEDVRRFTNELHQTNCPQCNGPGPVDVYTSHRVWSMLVMTSWSSRPRVCCRACSVKSYLGSILFSGALGWWGFPWGLIMTPTQIVRNIVGMCSGPDPRVPSAQLEKMSRLQLATAILQQQQAQNVTDG